MSNELDSGKRHPIYLAFLVTMGLAGWSALLVAFYAEVGPTPPPAPGLVPFALFLTILIAARGLAFQLMRRSLLALDSAFYVAAVICLGSAPAGRLVALALTLDSLLRLLGAGRGNKRLPGTTWAESLSYVLYFGGMTGALLMGCGWLFGADAVIPFREGEEVVVLAKVLGIGGTLLLAHYAIQGLRMRLLGRPVREYLRTMALRGAVAEATLLPLAAVLVFIYKPEQPLAFVLLGATYILINFIVKRLSNTSDELEQRVAELETLSVTARRLTSSLQIHELVETIARETVRAIPEAEVLTLAHRGTDEGKLTVDWYERDLDVFQRTAIDVDTGVIGWVIEHNQASVIADALTSRHSPPSLGPTPPRSWMAVPIVIYGEVEGVLAIQSRDPSVFSESQLRLLEALGAQAAVALQNAQLYELAVVDGLTRLYVRRFFDVRLDDEIERSRRFDTLFSVVMMDIDNFKALNDTHGHVIGDRVLREVGRVVRGEMRGVDTAARYGGEEFAMVLPRTDLVSAYNQAERLRSLIADLAFDVDGTTVRVTASFGIAAFPESQATDAEDLLRCADRALYRAKKTGKNRVELFWADGSESPGKSSIREV